MLIGRMRNAHTICRRLLVKDLFAIPCRRWEDNIQNYIFQEDNFKVPTLGLFIGKGIESTFVFSSENSWSEIENLTFWVVIIGRRTALFCGASFVRGFYIP
jgi:hypothetical protein